MAKFDLEEKLAKHVSKPSEAAKPEFIVLYSLPGKGKSYLAATASELPGVRKTLIIDTEGSTVGTLANFDDDKIDIIRIDSEAPDAFPKLNAILDGLSDPEAEHSYDVVIIDTLDVAQDIAIKHFKENAPITRSGEPDGFALWGNVADWTVKTVGRRLRNAKFLAIAVVHEKEEKDKNGSLVSTLRLSGSAKDVWPGLPDVVAYLERKLIDGKPTTVAWFDTEDNKVTKNRFGFPAKVKNPTIPGLFKFIEDRSK